MKTVKFIKAHPAGILPETIHTVADSSADRWIAQGYAEELTIEAPALEPDPVTEPVTTEETIPAEAVVSEPVLAEAPALEPDAVTEAPKEEAKQDSKTSKKEKGDNKK